MPHKDIVFRVDGMMCQNNCGSTVQKALQTVKGVDRVTVSFASSSAVVTAEVTTPSEELSLVKSLVGAVDAVGFDASLMRDSEPDIHLSVQGMMCQKNCGKTVENAIRRVAGVTLAVVSFEKKEARVWGPRAAPDDVIEAVECVGFEAILSSSSKSDTEREHAQEGEPDAIFAIKNKINPLTDPIKLKNVLMQQDGVVSVMIDSKTQQAKVWGFLDNDIVMKNLKSAGYTVSLFNKSLSSLPETESSLQTSELTSQSSDSANHFVVPLLVSGMSCANCARGIENRLLNITGVLAVRVALLSGKVEVHYDITDISDTAVIEEAIRHLGYSAHVSGPSYAEGSAASAPKSLTFTVSGMLDGNCAARVEDMLRELPGMVSASVSTSGRARVEIDDSAPSAIGPRDVLARVKQLGYHTRLVTEDDKVEDPKNSSDIQEWRRLLLVCIALGGPVVILHFSMIFSSSLMERLNVPVLCGGGVLAGQVMMVCLNAPLQFLVGYRFYRGAYLSALHGSFGMDALVVTGTTIAFVYSCVQLACSCASATPTMHVFFETSGMLLLFVTMGKYFEAYAKGTTISSMANLLKLQPRKAALVVSGGILSSDGGAVDVEGEAAEEVEDIDVELIQRGDVVKIYPGSRLPTDGVIVSGSSYIDESLITVFRTVGSAVYGSTVNEKGLLYVKVTSVGSDSALAQIVQLVEAAQMNKAPIQAYADVVAGYFTPFVLCLALLTFLIWFFVAYSGQIPDNWYADAGYGKNPLLFSLLFCISVVVVSCPCALGLATPTAIMVGTSVGAANGILIKGGPPFEVAHKINAIIFDKTGTLTKGKPTVTDEIDLHSENTELNRRHHGLGVDKSNQVLQLAAIAEMGSEHPLGESIVHAAKLRSLPLPDTSQADFRMHAGGVSCTYQDGTSIRVGNRGMMQAFDIDLGSLVDSAMWDLEVQGKTAVCVAFNSVIVGILGIADVVKPEAASAVATLHRMKVDVWMVTGDNKTTAEAIGDEIGISTDKIIAGAFPGDKVRQVEQLHRLGRHVAMVGDGINDSPALARSDLGIAVGAGTHIAIDAADMVIVRNNLLDVIVALDLAKVVFRRIKVNLRWAMLYNVLAIPIAAGAFFPWLHTILPPQYAGLCMALSSISVVASSLMLKCYQRPASCLPQEDLQPLGQTATASEEDRSGGLAFSPQTSATKLTSAISRARGRLVRLKSSLIARAAGSSDQLGAYSRLPAHEDGAQVPPEQKTREGDVELGGIGIHLMGLPSGGLPPSMEWDE